MVNSVTKSAISNGCMWEGLLPGREGNDAMLEGRATMLQHASGLDGVAWACAKVRWCSMCVFKR